MKAYRLALFGFFLWGSVMICRANTIVDPLPPLTWTLRNVVLSDGGTLTGTFVFTENRII